MIKIEMPIRGWMRLFMINDTHQRSQIELSQLIFIQNVEVFGYYYPRRRISFWKFGNRKKIQYADHSTAIDTIHLFLHINDER